MLILNPNIFKSCTSAATFIALLVVTALIAGATHGVTAVLILAMVKILLVTFRFMDLRHAQLFWKSAIVLLAGGFLAAIGLLATR